MAIVQPTPILGGERKPPRRSPFALGHRVMRSARPCRGRKGVAIDPAGRANLEHDAMAAATATNKSFELGNGSSK